MDDTKFDAKRRLCPDGSCIGVIGPSGRCSECGRAPGDTPAAPEAPPAEDLTEDSDRVGAGELRSPEPVAGGVEPSQGSTFATRRLCEDGSCLGVIGPDGRCNVCGTKAA